MADRNPTKEDILENGILLFMPVIEVCDKL